MTTPAARGSRLTTVMSPTTGGPFTLWQSATSQTSATYTGQNGHAYAFYSLATDHVAHREAAPAMPATTTVGNNPWHNYMNPDDADGENGVTPLDVLTLINYINSHPGDLSLPASPASAPPYYDVTGGRPARATVWSRPWTCWP